MDEMEPGEEEEDTEPDLGVFNDVFVEKLDRSFDSLDAFQSRSLLSKLGKIALYLRLYRTWVYSPVTGHHGFYRYFPQPPVQFHPDIHGTCSAVANFTRCLDMIFENIQQRAKFMFPLRDQKVEDIYPIDEEDFINRVSNTKFNFDISASYLLCFLTKNRLSILERLPFCGYGFESHQNREWPAGPFRQYSESPELWPSEVRPTTNFDPIDEIWEQREFQCADVSFCPDPCCGRNSSRFFNESAPPSSASDSGWCAHSACSMNIRHLGREVVSRHFGERKIVEEYRNRTKGEKEDEEEGTTNTNMTMDQHGGSSTVNTHYCYLEEPVNDDFVGIMENRWNLTCACAFPDNNAIDHSKIYRFDVHRCVDVDECAYPDLHTCTDGQQCVNQPDGKGYRCECPLGSMRTRPEEEDSPCELFLQDDDDDIFPKNLLQ